MTDLHNDCYGNGFIPAEFLLAVTRRLGKVACCSAAIGHYQHPLQSFYPYLQFTPTSSLVLVVGCQGSPRLPSRITICGRNRNELVQRSGQFLRKLIVELMAYCAHASGSLLDFAWLSLRFSAFPSDRTGVDDIVPESIHDKRLH
ncbi:hypothetical protein T07_1890 [Trichinella nelsoni]|uniref:Uncharacterized protein n=1 Tax=Trichinella nelsoni TaxID=6336 RepID=A0A0V0SFX3_9BILA|nr:hypothetical protein T07_1890 [Trichinella nelsoni]